MVAERHGEQEPAHGRLGHAAAAAGEEVLEVHAAHGLPVLAVRPVAGLGPVTAAVRPRRWPTGRPDWWSAVPVTRSG